ncbi:CDP-alcohol phosphatidyltransferase [Citrobacter rodentium]|jgi:Phosphatidylglycerophosphate synthase|uniref:CDP-alcohol phosphatidyltransferase n=2 Tax=Citrobacter rodentium TaxID=67825 RepID=D2TK58_CITRI|nr:CDP-alcohol phosphatidyltransferase [Citrobacter rodentium]KIQ49613.1 hypothetical protein TA05_20180 [Citrobacter rodentium]QBY28217.1 CDP-alcohol phosphatidyltransferase family protein [Citrobacter rodentium]UHO29907.1 CDP-alcohol phosphatidyltransferase family protein [Citrobacter rodentium NBRC 105723 = DSM 16636]CBG88396.1 putative CDP-alcohol phosphatidyltransferase [Citrobacter rodentium ICC168]HAT8011596.1 CDP-alcohol phosphatidyltransferase family protein [Citrobacter rodentium NBR
MTLYRIKPAFQALLRPLMFWLHKHRVTANHITLAAIGISFLTGGVLLFFPRPELLILLPVVLFVRMALNALDGMLAQTINGVRSYAGPLGKSDRALVFGAWGLVLSIWPQLATWNNAVWSIAIILLLWTSINRCRSVLGAEEAK